MKTVNVTLTLDQDMLDAVIRREVVRTPIKRDLKRGFRHEDLQPEELDFIEGLLLQIADQSYAQ